MTTLTIAELADKAADEVERRGLAHGTLGDDYDNLDGCAVCALGALAAAYYGDPFAGYDRDGNGYDALRAAVFDALPATYQKDAWGRPVPTDAAIYTWNDERVDGKHVRDARDVVAVLRGVAEAHR